jgi:hypothetical protein
VGTTATGKHGVCATIINQADRIVDIVRFAQYRPRFQVKYIDRPFHAIGNESAAKATANCDVACVQLSGYVEHDLATSNVDYLSMRNPRHVKSIRRGVKCRHTPKLIPADWDSFFDRVMTRCCVLREREGREPEHCERKNAKEGCTEDVGDKQVLFQTVSNLWHGFGFYGIHRSLSIPLALAATGPTLLVTVASNAIASLGRVVTTLASRAARACRRKST